MSRYYSVLVITVVVINGLHCISLLSFFLSLFYVFNCCLSQSLSIRLEKGDYP